MSVAATQAFDWVVLNLQVRRICRASGSLRSRTAAAVMTHCSMPVAQALQIAPSNGDPILQRHHLMCLPSCQSLTMVWLRSYPAVPFLGMRYEACSYIIRASPQTLSWYTCTQRAFM